MATSFCDTVKFKVYLNIENNVFKVHRSPQELKKIQISALMGIYTNIQLLKMTIRVIVAIKIIY